MSLNYSCHAGVSLGQISGINQAVIENRTHVWRMAVAVTLIACWVVVVTNWILYPPEDLVREMVIGLTIAVSLAFPISFYMGLQILRNFDLAEELKRLAYRDRLTDVATRDFFFKRMDAAPEDHGVSLVIDIDHFK